MAYADDSSELQQCYVVSKERFATVASTSVPRHTAWSGGVGDWGTNARWTVQGGKDSVAVQWRKGFFLVCLCV